MSAPARVATFGALLVAIFALAAIAGRAVDPATDGEHAHDAATASGHGGHAGHAAHAAGGQTAAEPRIVTSATTLTAGRPARFALRIAAGATILRPAAFQVEQGRRMHLLVVRRDLRRFQHLHPRQAADGTWSVRLTLPEPGAYTAFADFRSAGARHAPSVDLLVPGRFEPLPLPAPSTRATTDGYDVALHAHGGELRFDVSRDGAPVADLQPYLGARGHLVMLRAGDLAYEHVHPLTTSALAFDGSGAQPGTYRLFLQFRHGGRVHTAALTHALTP